MLDVMVASDFEPLQLLHLGAYERHFPGHASRAVAAQSEPGG
jgi:hypothetical protein